MSLNRREFISAGAAAGALLIGNPLRAGALVDHYGTSRSSRLFPGTFLAHADLHNHSLYSDGDGDAKTAFASMRDAGLDVVALTDHATLAHGQADSPCPGRQADCQGLAGIDEETWERTRRLADRHYADNDFVSIRGFEWSSPTLGHMNVWFSEKWIDVLHTGGLGHGENAGSFAHGEGGFPSEITDPLDAIIAGVPLGDVSMNPFYQWLSRPPDTPVLEGGLDGLCGFNHPGREPGRFSLFAFNAVVEPRLVSMEIFNRREDYLFEGTDGSQDSPLVQCLEAGWHPGLLGVTDEHGTDWGLQDGKGRAGLWVSALDRDGVREAMLARRFFATNLKGLRLDAAAGGVRMGQSVPHTSGPLLFEVDVDRGAAWEGKELQIQLLRPGAPLPQVIANAEVAVPTPAEPVLSFSADVDIADGGWIVLRISDPEQPPDSRAPLDWQGYGKAVAYTSPWWLQA